MARPKDFDVPAGTLLPKAPYGPYVAIVQRVVDGDTFDAIVDIGFHVYVTQRFRLKATGDKGVDAYEMHGRSIKRGRAAKAWVESVMPAGTPVLIHTRPDPDLYGRYFAEVTISAAFNDVSGVSWDLGTRLVELGHAKYREW